MWEALWLIHSGQCCQTWISHAHTFFGDSPSQGHRDVSGRVEVTMGLTVPCSTKEHQLSKCCAYVNKADTFYVNLCWYHWWKIGTCFLSPPPNPFWWWIFFSLVYVLWHSWLELQYICLDFPSVSFFYMIFIGIHFTVFFSKKKWISTGKPVKYLSPLSAVEFLLNLINLSHQLDISSISFLGHSYFLVDSVCSILQMAIP